MNSYCIYIVSPEQYAHSHAFDEHALCLHHAFAELGFEAPVVRRPEDVAGTPVVLGGNLVHWCPRVRLPDEAIIYNLEQVLPGSPWISESYLQLLRRHPVWDYSANNIRSLAELGVEGVRLCPVGYMPQLAQLQPPSSEPDIDVLFYGSLNDRRAKILEDLERQGVRVTHLFGCYGERRDRFIMRSKIVLNIHFFESKVLEIIRVAYLLANRRFVISETGSDPELEAPFAGALALADYDDLVLACLSFLADPIEREAIAERGHALFARRSQAEFLRPLVTS